MSYLVTTQVLETLFQQGIVSVADAAARLALDPAVTDQLVLEIDTGDLYRWHDSAWQNVGSVSGGGGGATNLSYDPATRIIASDTGTDATLPEVIAAGNSGLMTGADKTKLDGIEAGAQVNVGTDLTYTPASRLLASSTGADATLPEVVAAGNSGLMTGADKTKLDGIAAGAQVNVGTDLTYTPARRLLASSTGADATLPEVIAAGNSGLMTGADKTKLDGIAAGAQVNVGTDLTYTPASRLLASSTGADATLPEVVAAGNSGLMTGADKTKLDGIEAGATADQSGAEIVAAIDAQLGSADWQSGGGGGDVAADSLTVNGFTRTKTMTVTGPSSIVGEPGVTYHADLRTGDVVVTAPATPQAGDTLRGRIIATGLGTFTICGIEIVPGGGTVERIAGVSGVPATWRLGGVGP